METKVTSKTSSLKALLLRAWRERWSDLQWGINIKKILPRGVSGDVYNLADCILQQALVGLGPNQLILSYLKHSLCSQLVSSAAVLQRISKYDAFHKPHCIISLLEFLEHIHVGITCRSKPEEDLLAASILSIVHWLLQCFLYALTKPVQSHSLWPQPTELVERSANILRKLLNSDFIRAMLYLAKHDDNDLYLDVVEKCNEIESIQKSSTLKCPIPMDYCLEEIYNLEIENLIHVSRAVDSESVSYCIQSLLAVQNTVNPSTETAIYVKQLLMIQRLKNYSNSRLYCEIIRGGMMCLHDVSGTYKESQWGGFAVLKTPRILKELHITLYPKNENLDYSQDVLDALEELLRYTPLLDKMDMICLCNIIECLLTELQKLNLVTEKQAKHVLSKREGPTVALQKLDPSSVPVSSIPKVIIRAEPTLAGILKTLNAEYTKIQDALLSMLCQVLNGNSLELMLSVATVEGKLKTFVTRLIKFNECSRQTNEAVHGKSVATRHMLFDISFLMLCSIVQAYGSDIVLEEGGNSFFEQWVRECMPERNKPKSPNKMLQNVDPARVAVLLSQINSGETDFKSNNIKWHVTCQSAMGAVKELLYAWESGALSTEDVKRALDNFRSTACCLSICATAWLCAYMSTIPQDSLLKPMNMIQKFLTPIPCDDMQDDNFKERSNLMFQIIRRMQCDINPPTPPKTKMVSMSQSIVSKQPILKELQTIWNEIYQQGWLSITGTQSLESLIQTGGSLWFVTNLVHELLKVNYQEELNRSVDLIFTIFHLDIENCTLNLLNTVLPYYLHDSLLSIELVEPHLSSLAKLAVYCIYSTLESNNMNPQQNNSRKRMHRDFESDESDALGLSANKLLRLNESGDANLMFTSNSPPGPTSGQKSIILRDPLQQALNVLFDHFTVIAGRDGQVSRQMCFILKFLQFIVQCGKDRARVVLQGMPQTLVPCLLKALPEFFTTDLLLKLYDIQTAAGRKATARDLCMLRNINLNRIK